MSSLRSPEYLPESFRLCEKTEAIKVSRVKNKKHVRKVGIGFRVVHVRMCLFLLIRVKYTKRKEHKKCVAGEKQFP